MSEQSLREALVASFKNRAMIYWLIFDELRAEFGAEKAAEVMSRAIYRRGRQQGAAFAQFGPGQDLEGLKQAFLGGIPDDGRLFSPRVFRDEPDALEIEFMTCPLKAAWEEAGLPEEDRVELCRIAAAVDQGLFDAAGFDFSPTTWTPGKEGCCTLRIRRSPGA